MPHAQRNYNEQRLGCMQIRYRYVRVLSHRETYYGQQLRYMQTEYVHVLCFALV